MLTSTLRGLATHTADDTDGTGPDYKFGWGLFNARTAALLMESNYVSQSLAYIKEVRLTNGDSVEFPVVATNTKPLRVTICWTDPPGTPPGFSLNPTNRMLVNDLDLRVISAGGVTNLPWILNPASPTNAATTGDNIRDNVERVDIASPTSGAYTVRITHKGTLVNSSNFVSDQWVPVLLSGNLPQPQPALTLGRPLMIGGNAALKWPSVVGRIYARAAGPHDFSFSKGGSHPDASSLRGIPICQPVTAPLAIGDRLSAIRPSRPSRPFRPFELQNLTSAPPRQRLIGCPICAASGTIL